METTALTHPIHVATGSTLRRLRYISLALFAGIVIELPPRNADGTVPTRWISRLRTLMATPYSTRALAFDPKDRAAPGARADATIPTRPAKGESDVHIV